MMMEFKNGSTIQGIDNLSANNCVRVGDTRYREWTEKEVENLKTMLKYIKDNLYKFYKG